MFVTLLLSSAAALGLGLLISAAVSEPSQATVALPMVCFPQVLFVGAFLPVPAMAVVGRWISYAMTNRWAFEALGNSLGRAPRCGQRAARRSGRRCSPRTGPRSAGRSSADWLILAGFTVAFLAATVAIVVAQDQRRRASAPRGSRQQPRRRGPQQRSRGARPARSAPRSR